VEVRADLVTDLLLPVQTETIIIIIIRLLLPLLCQQPSITFTTITTTNH
jgi:hypothetical protein